MFLARLRHGDDAVQPVRRIGIERAFMPTRKMLNVVWNRCSMLA